MSEIRKEVKRGKLEVSRVFEGKYQKQGTMTAELRQEVTVISYYPSMRIENDMQGNIFDNEAFDIKDEPRESKEIRVTWIPVPASKTIEEVKKALENLPKAHLYRVLSNAPILTDDQKSAINNGVTTLEKIAEGDGESGGQVVRYGSEHEKAGTLILDKLGKVQYRKVFFSPDGSKEDQDLRTSDESMYLTENLAVELQAVEQTV